MALGYRPSGSLHAALTELGVLDDVVTFTASDFGRTLTSNGQGSDHAWGGNHMVMGGPVASGDIYGTFPQLFADGFESGDLSAWSSVVR